MLTETEWYVCEICNCESTENNDMIYGGRVITVCDDCADSEGEYCSECDTLFYCSELNEIDRNTHVCDACLRRHYSYCERCCRYTLDNHYNPDYCMCNDCADETMEEEEEACDGYLHQYSYTPQLTFFRGEGQSSTNQLYFGVELEYHCINYHTRYDAVTGWAEHNNNRWYCKQDSSLQNGFEAVSHPHTLDAWAEQYNAVNTLLTDAESVGAFCNDNSGLHIHISKSGMSDSHKARFSAFVHLNADNLIHIARRPSSNWAEFKKKSPGTYFSDGTGRQYNRYEAVNWHPSRTVELRFFQSTLNVSEFYAAIEFAHAAYQFTKTGAVGMQHICRDSEHAWPLFREFVRGSRKYPKLREMVKFGLI